MVPHRILESRKPVALIMQQLVEIKPLALSVPFLIFGSGPARPHQIFRILLTAVQFEPNFENIN